MSELKRTILYQAHLDAGATMVDFGGWDMPIQYPDGIVAEHLYCRSHCAIFDVSHMGRIDVEGPDMVRFLQHVLSSNVQALDINQAQYCIIPNQNGCALDDAYLYRFEAEKYFLVINAGNIDKDLAHLTREAERYNVTLTNVSDRYAAIAVQGPEAKKLLMALPLIPLAVIVILGNKSYEWIPENLDNICMGLWVVLFVLFTVMSKPNREAAPAIPENPSAMNSIANQGTPGIFGTV